MMLITLFLYFSLRLAMSGKSFVVIDLDGNKAIIFQQIYSAAFEQVFISGEYIILIYIQRLVSRPADQPVLRTHTQWAQNIYCV